MPTEATIEAVVDPVAAAAAKVAAAAELAAFNAEMSAALKAAMEHPSPIAGTVLQPIKFTFKKDDLGVKRPTVELALPVPTADTVTSMLADEKQRNYLLSVLADQVYLQARQQVGNESSPVNKQDQLDLTKLTMEYIASIPPSERRGGGISKETWADFFKDYIEVMPSVTGKNKEQVENAGKLFVARLQPVKTQKKILTFLQSQLALWFTNTQAADDFAEVYEFLTGKIEDFLKRDEAELLQNL